jgi:hypothetical protein
MKRWAFLTVLLYLLILILLTVPVVLLAFGPWARSGNGAISVTETLRAYQEWGYWAWLGVLGLGQMFLLLVPLRIAERRTPPRRPLLMPVIVTGCFISLLFLAATASVLFALYKENGLDVFAMLGAAAGGRRLAGSLNNPQGGTATSDYIIGTIAVFTLFWLFWGLIFYRSCKADDPNGLVKRMSRWLVGGSILELLVAVPSHVVVRNRNDCCAPMGTFWGITTGLAVMLMCFGPGVFFLFVERINRLRPKTPGSQGRPAAIEEAREDAGAVR